MSRSHTRISRLAWLGSTGMMALATAAQAQSQGQAPAAPSNPLSVEEIVVSATKRPEAVRSISGSVTALTEAQLEALGAQDMADYLTRTPGVVFNAGMPGNSSVSIRGVSTTTGLDQGQGTTGYFINDVPLTDPYNSVAIPDIDTFDVDNVSVLRGPQGTLFGSASLGGAVNYQAAKPDLTQYEAHIQASGEGTENGAFGGSGKVMVNVPVVEDTLAVRAVYVYRDDAGYIDNIGTGQKDANQTITRGGRLEALWSPSADTKISYLFLDQAEYTNDLGYQEPLFAGSLEKNTFIAEPANFKTVIHNLRLDQDLGFATLTATATYHYKTQFSPTDITQQVQSFLPGVIPAYTTQAGKSEGTTFEARLASPTGERFEYLIGAMHDDTRETFVDLAQGSNATQIIEALYGPAFGAGIGKLTAPNNVFFDAAIPVRGQESALFGEATYHLDDQWKATFGGRAFHTKVTNGETESGFLNLVSAGQLVTTGSGSQSSYGFTPKGSVTWTPNSDFMAYGLIDEGFRFGGPNLVSGPTVPAHFNSDSLVNYELGTRTSWLDKKLQLDGSVFYIDWSNIQLHLETPLNLNYAANAGKAHIWGAEGTATWAIAHGLNFQTNLTYLDAELASPFDPGGGQPIVPKGSTLPGASKWQVSDTLTYNWSDAPLEPSFVLAHRYISEAPGIFLTGAPQGGYNLVDFRASALIRDVQVTAFIDNIGDARGVTTANYSPQLQEYLVRPRTVGITLDYQF